jgi:aladin
LFNTLIFFCDKQLDSHVEDELEKVFSSRPIRTISWNVYHDHVAIAHKSNAVWMFDLENESYNQEPLIHELQQGVKCMAWKPMSGTTLAVGCDTGIAIWRVALDVKEVEIDHLRENSLFLVSGSNTLSNQPKIAKTKIKSTKPYMRFLTMPKEKAVNNLSWDPRGERLAVTSTGYGTIVIWDVATEEYSTLDSIRFHAKIVEWSPTGEFLFVAGL